ncbi:hypothetical protein BsWGS_03396 [Bradybaena similaris]
MQTDSKRSNDMMVIISSIVIIIISIICAAIVSNKVGQMEKSAHEPHFKKEGFNWCLPCRVLEMSHNLDLVEKMNRTFIKDVEHCCAYDMEQATSLLEMMSSTAVPEVQRTFDPGKFSLSKASAHRQLRVSTYTSMNKLYFPESENVNLGFDLSKENPLTEHTRNITVTRLAMEIQLPGQYYVYSSIFFKPDGSKPCKEFAKQIWEHNIVLTRSGDKVHSGIIFNTTYTCCDTCKEHKRTSFAGGVFSLKENDRLHVEVSSDGVVSFRKEASYFGLFMVA